MNVPKDCAERPGLAAPAKRGKLWRTSNLVNVRSPETSGAPSHGGKLMLPAGQRLFYLYNMYRLTEQNIRPIKATKTLASVSDCLVSTKNVDGFSRS